MANKKLRLEVELETAKAKRQAQDLVNPSSSFAGTTAESSRSAEKLERATVANTRQMMTMTRAFAGMAVGLAASYASRYYDRGSTMEKAFGYGGAAIMGASSGAMIGRLAGPYGAAIGAVAGGGMSLGKEYLDRAKELENARKEWEESESEYEGNKRFAAMLNRLTSSTSGELLATRFAQIADQYDFYLELIEEIKSSIQSALDDGRIDDFNKLQKQLATARQRSEALLKAGTALDNMDKSSPMAGRDATSAFQKVGGGWGLPTNYAKRGVGIVDVITAGGTAYNFLGMIEQLLRDIRENTGKKGQTSWL